MLMLIACLWLLGCCVVPCVCMCMLCRCWCGIIWLTSCMYLVMMWLGIVGLGSSMFSMTVAIVCVIFVGNVLCGWKGCFASLLQAWCIMVVTMFGIFGMVGSWVEMCGLVSWYVMAGGGHLCWMLLLCSSSYRVQFGNMFWDACAITLLHVRHVWLVLGLMSVVLFGGSCTGGIGRGFLVVFCFICVCSGRVGFGCHSGLFAVDPVWMVVLG